MEICGYHAECWGTAKDDLHIIRIVLRGPPNLIYENFISPVVPGNFDRFRETPRYPRSLIPELGTTRAPYRRDGFDPHEAADG
jgi:hypothetical protein